MGMLRRGNVGIWCQPSHTFKLYKSRQFQLLATNHLIGRNKSKEQNAEFIWFNLKYVTLFWLQTPDADYNLSLVCLSRLLLTRLHFVFQPRTTQKNWLCRKRLSKAWGWRGRPHQGRWCTTGWSTCRSPAAGKLPWKSPAPWRPRCWDAWGR